MKNLILFLVCTFLFSADDKAPSQRTRDRDVDIHHIKIDVTIDLEEKSVSGNVTHTLSLLSDQIDKISFDSKNIIVKSISVAFIN